MCAAHCRDIRALGDMADASADPEASTKLGFNGSCMLLKAVPHADARFFIKLPVLHMLLYGVVKGFWEKVLLPASGTTRTEHALTSRLKAELARRGRHLRMTHDFKRRYR